MLCIQCFLLSQNGDNVCGGRGVAVQAYEGVVVLNTLTVFVVMCDGGVVGGVTLTMIVIADEIRSCRCLPVAGALCKRDLIK